MWTNFWNIFWHRACKFHCSHIFWNMWSNFGNRKQFFELVKKINMWTIFWICKQIWKHEHFLNMWTNFMKTEKFEFPKHFSEIKHFWSLWTFLWSMNDFWILRTNLEARIIFWSTNIFWTLRTNFETKNNFEKSWTNLEAWTIL